MPIVLKNQDAQVIDHLRSSRKAEDAFSRLQENSWESRRKQLVRMVESSGWRFGPAQHIATFDHHFVCKAPNGNLVRVEWKLDDNKPVFGQMTVFESAQPVADLGREVMETAKSAVDMILDEDFGAAVPMVESIADALDASGDLQRRINTEVTVRSISRDAWWHKVIGEREEFKELLPAPQTEGENALLESVLELQSVLEDAARGTIAAVRQLDLAPDLEVGIEALARDIAEDIHQALQALMALDQSNHEEMLPVYEAVMSIAPHLLNGFSFLTEMAEIDTHDDHEGQE